MRWVMEATEMRRESVSVKNSASRDGFGSSDLGVQCWHALVDKGTRWTSSAQ